MLFVLRVIVLMGKPEGESGAANHASHHAGSPKLSTRFFCCPSEKCDLECGFLLTPHIQPRISTVLCSPLLKTSTTTRKENRMKSFRNSGVSKFAISLFTIGLILTITLPTSLIQILHTAHAQSLTARWTSTNAPEFPAAKMTRLHNGKVVSVGIVTQLNEKPRRAAIYDPITDVWRETAPLNYARYEHTNILLNDGRLLIIGGSTAESGIVLPVPQPEIFDPATEKWTEVRIDTTSAEFVNMWLRSSFQYLRNGKVLVLSQIYNRAYLFDPETGSIRQAKTSPQTIIGNTSPSSILLRDGRVLFLSNESMSAIEPKAEIFDPDTESWSLVELPQGIGSAMSNRLAAILPDGSVLGLFTMSNRSRISASFDPLTGKWSNETTRYSQFPNTVTLTTGEVLAYRDNAAEIYNSASKTWRTIDAPTKSNSGAVLLASGQVYTGKELYGVDFGSTTTPTAVNASAASFRVEPLAQGSIASVFGANLGNSVRIKDQSGVEHPVDRLFAVTSSQINYLLPDNIPTGQAEMFIGNQRALLSIINVSPGLFTANADGRGVPAAVIVRVKADGSQTFEPVARFDSATSRFIPAAIDLGSDAETVFLALFGTGARNRTSLGNTLAYIGGVKAPVQFIGAQGGFDGLDQINVQIPRSLLGRGDVDVLLTVDGKTANPVAIKIN